MIRLKDLDTVTSFVGLPGTGKTTVAASIVKYINKLNKKNKDHEKDIKVFSNVPIIGAYSYSWDDFGLYNMDSSVILLDESGLEVDNRSWEKNFGDKRKVEMLKLLRHRHCKLVYFSQTWNDTDVKIRSMTSRLYIVRHSLFLFTTVCIPVYRSIDVNEETHQFEEDYRKDGILKSIFSSKRIFRPFYYKLFDSWSCTSLPEFKHTKIYERTN